MSLPLSLQPGTSLDGRYIVGVRINGGGFGAIYRGIDTSEGNRPCAIKETYDVTPSARRQALTEAGILFTVKSKHLPRVYDAFEANGRFYLVMQLIEGQNLQQLLRAQGYPCSEQQVITWLLPIMQVLQELHSRTPAIIHRDIKPSNIILTPDETAVLVDFGLTRLYDPDSNTQTLVRAVSEGFSPIEQYIGKTCPQSDIYSLAATMYFLLTEQTPPLATNRSMHDELIAPRLLNPSLSPKIERILLKALAVNQDERYQSMREFAQALQAPAFTGHADPTIVATSAQSTSAHTNSAGLATPSASSVNMHHIPPSLAPPPPPPQTSSAHQSPYAPSYPLPLSYVPAAPPGYVLVPQSALVPLQPMPSAFGQGCLWGLLQGIVAALLLLILKKDVYFYLGILMGFVFYLLAGFFTTRKGGSFSRGGWAGFWSGITSTVIFWVVLTIGLVVQLSQRVQADTLAAQQQGTDLPPDEISRAWQAVIPPLLNHPSTPSSGTALIVFLIGGLVLAITIGLLGGILGTSEYQDALKRRTHS